MLTTVRRSRPKGPLRAVPGATNNRKIGGRLCYCDITPPLESSVRDGPVQKIRPSSQPKSGGGCIVSLTRGCQGSDAKIMALIFFTAFGCLRWKALTLAFACVILAAGSQELSPAPRPFHLTRYWSWRRYRRLSRISSTSYSSSPLIRSGGGLG